jgi:hypothetical protein
MAKRKQEVQPELRPSPKPESVAQTAPTVPPLHESPFQSTPPLVEFIWRGVEWRCSRYELLVGEFGAVLTKERLEIFCETISHSARSWLIIRRLFGLQPVVPDAQASLEDMRAWDPDELCAALGINANNLREELNAVLGIWSQMTRVMESKEAETSTVQTKGPVELDLDNGGVIDRYGMRMKFEDREEMLAVADRLRDLESVLRDTMGKNLARNLIRMEVRLGRLNRVLDGGGDVKIGTKEYMSLQKMVEGLEKSYQKQVDHLQEMFPWLSVKSGKQSFRATLSDITAAYMEYIGRADTKLVDGMFTAAEILVEMRRSVQSPHIRYRAGLVAYVASAREGLFDPNWNPGLNAKQLTAFTEAWRKNMEELLDAAGQHVPDLTREGPEGEYEKLLQTPEQAPAP